MKFRFLWVGKTKNKNWLALQNDYLERLSHFAKFEIAELRDEGKELEGNRIIENINPAAFVVALDVEGKPLSSHGFAEIIENWQNRSLKEVCFLIGGAEGLSPGVLEKAGMRLSLSSFTLTHEAARVVLIEQIYRAFTIIKGFPYQK